jgi:hypothetical protein
MKLKQSLALLLCHISFILTVLALVVLFGI